MATIVFMGTPEFAVPTLRALIDHHEVIGVVTQPDRPAGRNRETRQSPVKQLAMEHHIPILQPAKLRTQENIDALRERWQPDVIVVAAFGQILPQEVLNIAARGSINVHASLLPRWRGAAPIPAAIRAGDTKTGITIMLMNAGLDTGPILSQREIPIAPKETGQTLHDRLAILGDELLIETLPEYLAGKINPQPQDDAKATYAPQIKKTDGEIDWSQDAASIERMIRAFTPWPGAYTYWSGKQIKIHAGKIGEGDAQPGFVFTKNDRVAIGTGKGLFYPTCAQREGKKKMSIRDFARGYHGFIHSTLGT